MAEFLKAKRTTVMNKPIGVVNTNTGGFELGMQVLRAGQDAFQIGYADAVKKQKEVGAKTVRGMKSVVTRDTDGQLSFEELPQNLSDVARETAQPMLLKRYANELDVQTSNQIAKIAIDTKSFDEFQSKTNAYIEATTKQLNKTGVGQDVLGIYMDSATKLSAQYGIKKYQEEITQKENDAIQNSVEIMNRFLNDAKQYRINGMDESADMNMEAYQTELETLRGRIGRREFNQLERGIILSDKIATVTKRTTGMSSVELNFVERSLRDRTFENLPKEIKDKLQLDNNFFADMNEADLSQIEQDIAGRASNQSTIETGLKTSISSATANANNLKGIGIDNKKNRESANLIFSNYDSPQKWLTNSSLLNDNVGLTNLRRMNVMPSHLKNALEMVSNNPSLSANQVVLLNNYRKQFQYVDGVSKKLPISTELLADFNAFDKLLTFYGAENAQQAYEVAFKGGAETDEARNFEIKRKLSSNGQGNTSSLIQKFVYDTMNANDMVSEAKPMIRTVSEHLLSNKNISKDMAEELVTDLYNQMFTPSKYTFSNTTKTSKVASRFAPEKFLQGDKLEEFVNTANRKLALARTLQRPDQVANDTVSGINYKLGVNAFLLPNPNSGDNKQQYIIVDENGLQILDKNNYLIEMNTSTNLQNILKNRIALQEKLNKALKGQKVKEEFGTIGSGGVVGEGVVDQGIRDQMRKMKDLMKGN